MAEANKLPVCAVVGVGPGNGEAIARRFAADGYAVALMARRTELTGQLAAELPEQKPMRAMSPRRPRSRRRSPPRAPTSAMSTRSSITPARASGAMSRRSRPRISSARGGSTRSASFCPLMRPFPRCAARGRGRSSLSARPPRGGARRARRRSRKPKWRSARSPNSMARHLWPAGIHVALVVVDGVVGGPVTRSRFTDRPDEFFIAPTGVAAIAADLVAQDRSAWSFEVEARPFKEKW